MLSQISVQPKTEPNHRTNDSGSASFPTTIELVRVRGKAVVFLASEPKVFVPLPCLEGQGFRAEKMFGSSSR